MAEREKPGLIRVMEVDAKGNPIGYKTVRADEVRTDTPRRGPLPAELKERAERLYDRCGRQILGMTPDEWLGGFERDLNPASEIRIWEEIARIADTIWTYPISIKYAKSQVDQAVALALSGYVDVPSGTGVSDEFVRVVRELYEGRGAR